MHIVLPSALVEKLVYHTVYVHFTLYTVQLNSTVNILPEDVFVFCFVFSTCPLYCCTSRWHLWGNQILNVLLRQLERSLVSGKWKSLKSNLRFIPNNVEKFWHWDEQIQFNQFPLLCSSMGWINLIKHKLHLPFIQQKARRWSSATSQKSWWADDCCRFSGSALCDPVV